MSNLEKAKLIFKEGDYTCVLVNDGEVLTSRDTGVKPLVAFAESNKNFNGFAAADKIVGRAAAFLYAVLGVSEVYAEVLSDGAAEVLKAYKINFSCAVSAKNIINRRGDGPCPMESAVANICEKNAAFAAIKAKLFELTVKN